MNFKLVAIIIEREQETVVLEKSLQKNTQEEDQQFLWLLENMTDAFMSVNARWECTSVNHQAEEALGKTQRALVGGTLWEIFPASLATPFYQKAHEVMEQRIVLPCTVSYPPLKRWFTGRMVPFQAGIALFFHDTTFQMQAEQTFQSVAEHIPDIIMRVDAQFRHLYVNAAVTRATGFPPEKFLGKTHRDLGMPEELVAYWDRHLAEVFANGTEQMFDFAFPAPDGMRYFQAHLVPEYDLHGNIVSVLGISRDITAQQQVQQALQRSERRLHVWIENVADIITILDKEGTILYQSPAVERVLGWKAEECIKQNVFRSVLVHPEDRQKKQTFFTTVLHSLDATITSTFRMRHKDGSYRFIEARGRNLLTSPDIQSIIATYRDVTEREELEQRKDEFMSMASHELKTPLTSLKGYTQVLKMELESLDLQQTVEDLLVMEHQIDTLIRLIGDFLDVSRIKAGKLAYQQEVFALDPFVQQMIAILQRISPHHTILLTGESHASIMGDRERLGQVLVNLVTNAIKYAPGTDAIEIHIASTRDAVTISVQDNGIGIAREHQQKIFERFYRVSNTTGPAVSGLGMGLYISSEIVLRHKGKIWVESDEGQGACFSFSLPVVTQE